MAKRASLNRAKADALLSLPDPAQPGQEAAGAAVFAQIGDDTATTQRVLEEIPLERIRPNPYQPRWAIDAQTVEELAHSMRQRGFFGSLTARKQGRWYELAYGHQRLEAARLAGIAALPLEIRALSDEEMLEYALAENLQRKDLTQLEEGEIFARWQQDLGRSERDIAERLGKSRGYVRNRIATARLPEDLKQLLRDQAGRALIDADGMDLPARFELSPAAAKELARLEDEAARRQLTSEVLSRQLNFQQTKTLVDRSLHPPKAPVAKNEAAPDRHFGRLMFRLEAEARRVRPAERDEALRALEELIARAEQIRESLRTMR